MDKWVSASPLFCCSFVSALCSTQLWFICHHWQSTWCWVCYLASVSFTLSADSTPTHVPAWPAAKTLLLQANGLFRNPSALLISSYHNTLTCILQILGACFICCIVPCLHLCACLFILYPEGTSHALNLSIFTNTRVLSGKQSRWVWVTWGAFLITSLPRSLSCSLFSCLQSTRKLAS